VTENPISASDSKLFDPHCIAFYIELGLPESEIRVWNFFPKEKAVCVAGKDGER